MLLTIKQREKSGFAKLIFSPNSISRAQSMTPKRQRPNGEKGLVLNLNKIEQLEAEFSRILQALK